MEVSGAAGIEGGWSARVLRSGFESGWLARGLIPGTWSTPGEGEGSKGRGVCDLG